MLKKKVYSRKPTHLVELQQLCQEEWLNIHPEEDPKLLDGNQKHLTDVKMAERLLTKYYNHCLYIYDPADVITFSEDL